MTHPLASHADQTVRPSAPALHAVANLPEPHEHQAPATNLPGLLSGLTYQTPVIGTIKIGGIREKDGKRLPFTDDQFSINTRYRDSEGQWVPHRVQQTLEKDTKNVHEGRLNSIPVRIIYDNPNLNFGEQYAAFTTNGRPACVGNGQTAKRVENGKVQSVACPGSAGCEYGSRKEHRCDAFARALFHIEGQDESEGAFIFRTGSYNSVNDMRVRLQSLHAGFGGKLSGLPMKLVMRLKSTAQSFRQAFYYVSLEPRFAGFKEGMQSVNERAAEEASYGFNRPAFEACMTKLLGNGAFSENVEDADEFEDLIAARPDSPSGLTSPPAQNAAAAIDLAKDLESLAGQYAAVSNTPA
jgi:hypothetical protein